MNCIVEALFSFEALLNYYVAKSALCQYVAPLLNVNLPNFAGNWRASKKSLFLKR